jgi:hypothetical protein
MMVGAAKAVLVIRQIAAAAEVASERIMVIVSK